MSNLPPRKYVKAAPRSVLAALLMGLLEAFPAGSERQSRLLFGDLLEKLGR